MNRRAVQQWANLVAVLATIAINGLANAVPFNGQTTGEVSDKFDVLFVPAGYVFAIWGLIYVGLLAFGIYQVLPGQRDNVRLRRVGYLFVLASLANIVWLPLWHYERFPLSLVAMVALLLSLIGIYLELNVGRARVPLVEKATVDVPFSIYLGWITVATIANVTDVLDYLGWGGWGIRPEVWTIIVLLAGLAISAAVSFTRGDVAYSAVLVWAYTGIAVKQGDTPAVVVGAWAIAALIVLVTGFGALRHRRLQRVSVGPA
jgi:hypothetical protein